MAPTDPTAKPHDPTKHSAYVVMSPAGEDTFSPRCSAHDFVTDEVFATASAARSAKSITDHIAATGRPSPSRYWATPPSVGTPC